MQGETKQRSWQSILEFVSSFQEPLWSDWKAFMQPLLQACIDAELDKHFRAGQSVSQIIISTAEEHGLEKYNPPQPLVTIDWKEVNNSRKYFVAYSHQFLFNSTPERHTFVDDQNAFSVLRSYMVELWHETKPGEPLPKGLAEASD